MKRIARRIAVATAALALLAGGLTIAAPTTTAPTAEAAATYWCNGYEIIQTSAMDIRKVPVYFSGKITSANCISGSGSYGGHVWAIQAAAKDCYKQNLKVDKDFGPITKAAVKVIQKRGGVTQDGVYGPVTGKQTSFMPWCQRGIHGIK
ncbi:MAG: peptidoglycan-binding protein [Propionibacteriaceae bacterium]|nr:peptidoglycan-binding protein [Propionibacteriaceae bacterium]